MGKDDYASLYLQLFDGSNDPQFILDAAANRFIKVNSAFENLTGYTKEELESGLVLPSDLKLPKQPPREHTDRSAPQDGKSAIYEYHISTKSSEVKILELSMKKIELFDRQLKLGSARDITKRKMLEERLKEEIDTQKQKTIEAAKASVRIYQLTEKIRNAPRMMNSLLHVEDVDSLLKESARLMNDDTGLNYAGVSFHLIEDGRLVKKFPPAKGSEAEYDLAKSASKYAAVARGDEQALRDATGELIVPIRARNEIMGVMSVRFDREEKTIFDDSETVRQGQEDIVRTLANSIGLMIDNLRLLAKVKQQSIVDQLTKVYNRRHFDQKMREEFRRARRYSRELSMAMVDLDHFKTINDTFGHQQGDRILVDVSRIFSQESRETDVICRYGGDEFLLLLPETGIESAWLKSERLRKIVEDTRFDNVSGIGSESLRMTISVGVASLGDEIADEIQFLRHADDALYSSKRNGRNKVSLPPHKPSA